MTIAILSIKKKIIPKNYLSFDDLYNAIGCNTGNLIFTNAVYDMIIDAKQIGFNQSSEFINENFLKLVIPAANWIGIDKKTDERLGNLANIIKQLKIPVVVIGLGVQSNDHDDNFYKYIGEGTLNFIKSISEKSVSISLRGEYTANVFKKLGISNICVTGCPSLQKIYNPKIKKNLEQFNTSKILLYPTRYWIDSNFLNSSSLNKDIFSYAFKNKIKINLQSESEEMAYLNSYPEIFEKREKQLLEIYNAENLLILKKYVDNYAYCFFDINEWIASIQNFNFGFGTRLHSTIMMINSGVPAVLACHDSRTHEVAEFANIPMVSAKDFILSHQNIEKLYNEIDMNRYYNRRIEIIKIFNDFLNVNSLKNFTKN
jgi:hypothetical protein